MRPTTSRHLGHKPRLATLSLTVLAALSLVSIVLAGDLAPGDAQCTNEPDHSTPVPEIDCKDECRYPGETTTVERLVSCTKGDGKPTMSTKTCTCSTDCKYTMAGTKTSSSTAIDCKTIIGETVSKLGSVFTTFTPTVTPNYDPSKTCTTSVTSRPYYSTCDCHSCERPSPKCDTDCEYFGTSTNAQGQYFSTGSMACSIPGERNGCPATPTTSTACNTHIRPTDCAVNSAALPNVDCKAICQAQPTCAHDYHNKELTVTVTTPFPATATASAFGGSKCPQYTTKCPCPSVDCTLVPTRTETSPPCGAYNCDTVVGSGVLTTATITTFSSTATAADFGGKFCPTTTSLSYLTKDCPCAPVDDANEECDKCSGMTKSVDDKTMTWAVGTKSCSTRGRPGCTKDFNPTTRACSTAAINCVNGSPPCINCDSLCNALPSSLAITPTKITTTTPFPHTLTAASNFGAECPPYSTTCPCQSTDCVSAATHQTLSGTDVPPDCDTVSGASTVTYGTSITKYGVLTTARFGGDPCGPLTSSTISSIYCPCGATKGATVHCDDTCTMVGRTTSLGTPMSTGTYRCTKDGRIGCSPTYFPEQLCHDQYEDCVANTAKPPAIDCTSICMSVPPASATPGYTTPIVEPFPTTLTYALNGGSTCAPYSTSCACSAVDCTATLKTVEKLLDATEPVCDTVQGDMTITYKTYESVSTVATSARFGGEACPTLTSLSYATKECPCTLPPNPTVNPGTCEFDGYSTAECGDRFRTGHLTRTTTGRAGCPNSLQGPLPCSTPVTDCTVDAAATPALDCDVACNAVPNEAATPGFTPIMLSGSYTATLTAAGNGGSSCTLSTKACPCSTTDCQLKATTTFLRATGVVNCDAVVGPATVTTGSLVTAYSTATPARFGGASCGPTESSAPVTSTCPCTAPTPQNTETGACMFAGTSKSGAYSYSTGTAALTASGRAGCPDTTTGTIPCSTRIIDCIVDLGSSPNFDCDAECDAVPMSLAKPGYTTDLSGPYARTLTAPAYGGSTCPTASTKCQCAPTPCALGGIKMVSTVSYMPEPSCSTLDGSTKIEWAKATTTFFVATSAKFAPACTTTAVGCVTKDCPCVLPENPHTKCGSCAFVATRVVAGSGDDDDKTISMGRQTCTTLGRNLCPSPTAVVDCVVLPSSESCRYYKHHGSIHPDVVVHSHIKQKTFNCDGVVVVGGDMTVPQITAGHGLDAPDNVCKVPSVLVRGQLDPDCGGVVSNGAVGVSKYNKSPFPKFLSVCPALAYTNEDDFKDAYDFDSARADHKQWADNLAAMRPTLKLARSFTISSMYSLSPIVDGGAWANDQDYAVVTWTQNNIVGLTNWDDIKAKVFDAGKTLVINASPDDKGDVTIVSGDWSQMYPTRVIWNFGRATSVTLGTQWKGMVLAPWADLRGSTEVEGAVICNSIIGASSFSFIHARNDDDDCVIGAPPVPPPRPPTPPPPPPVLPPSAL